jgi:phosphohistidine phosphatase
MNIYLLRHANPAENTVKVEKTTEETQEIAVEVTVEEPEENERRLTPKARKKIAKIARSLDKLDLEFDAILSSPYAYARQTAAIVAEAFDIKKKTILLSENLAPGGDAAKLIEEINALQDVENVLLVGHEPGLGQLTSLLVTGSAEAGLGLKKAGLCKLVVEELSLGRCAQLEWLLTPGQLVQV